MCGIAVSWGSTQEEQVRRMMDRIRHRGPDGVGLRTLGDAALGHVRLAILDVSGGAQPMTNEGGDLGIAFNGEIYNHLELRRPIEDRHRFRTRSDTEVILHLYEEAGEDMLGRLDGMFGLALAGPGGLLLARDPLGIKPVYYGRVGRTVLAASELKAFPPMDELRALPAGHAVIPGGEPWAFAPPLRPREPLREQSLPEILAEVRRRLDTAVRKRLMSDVPVGVYLSGGLDSSVVAALMRPHAVELHSFAAGLEGAPDLEAARRVARELDTTHHELVYTPEDVVRIVPEVVRCIESFDAPLVRSAVPMYLVSGLAARYVKVVLSGEGADELFAGYSYLHRRAGRKAGSVRGLKEELARITVGLQDTNLQRADRASMAHGLEARVPFLDMDLVRYAARIPERLLQPAEGKPEKWLLREACRGLLPPEIQNRRKMKFSEGAGSSEVMAKVLERQGLREWRPGSEVEAGLVPRSAEEAYYYRIWRDALGPHIPASLVGRTRDPGAAVEGVA